MSRVKKSAVSANQKSTPATLVKAKRATRKASAAASPKTPSSGRKWTDSEKNHVLVSFIQQALDAGFKPKYEAINLEGRSIRSIKHVFEGYVNTKAGKIKVKGVPRSIAPGAGSNSLAKGGSSKGKATA